MREVKREVVRERERGRERERERESVCVCVCEFPSKERVCFVLFCLFGFVSHFSFFCFPLCVMRGGLTDAAPFGNDEQTPIRTVLRGGTHRQSQASLSLLVSLLVSLLLFVISIFLLYLFVTTNSTCVVGPAHQQVVSSRFAVMARSSSNSSSIHSNSLTIKAMIITVMKV